MIPFQGTQFLNMYIIYCKKGEKATEILSLPTTPQD